MLKIENVSGRMQTYVLTGQHLAAVGAKHPLGYKSVKRVTVHHAKDGKLVARAQTQPMADSLRIAAGDVVVVDDAVGHCPAIKKAEARGELIISRAVKPPEPAPAPAPQKPASA